MSSICRWNRRIRRHIAQGYQPAGADGEILGIAGVSGNGQKELMTALSGERLSTSGSMIKLFGQPVGRSTRQNAGRLA